LKSIVPLIVFAMSATAATAQDTRANPEDSQNYQMMRQGSGFVRLNRETGIMSYCRVVTGNLICRPGAEEREAYLEALDRLTDRLEDAEGRLSRLEYPKNPDPVVTQAPPVMEQTDDEPTGGIGADGRLEQVKSLAGRVIRNFFAVVANFRDSLATRAR
jgi:hypothetical protein